MKISAGIMPFRLNSQNQLEVFLIHPGGPFFAKKDNGSWSIPKGEVNPGEDLFVAAQREFVEETGQTLPGQIDYVSLQPIKTTSGKLVHAWAVKMDFPAETCHSNTFSLEWPSRSGKFHTYPEADNFGWFDLDAASLKLTTSQLSFIDQVRSLVETSSLTT